MDGVRYVLFSSLDALVHPETTLGITPASLGRGCERGYHFEVAIVDGELRLIEMTVGTVEVIERPQEVGMLNMTAEYGEAKHSRLSVAIPFTGILTVATGTTGITTRISLSTPKKYGCYNDPEQYDKVLTLRLEDGRLVGRSDDQASESTVPPPPLPNPELWVGTGPSPFRRPAERTPEQASEPAKEPRGMMGWIRKWLARQT